MSATPARILDRSPVIAPNLSRSFLGETISGQRHFEPGNMVDRTHRVRSPVFRADHARNPRGTATQLGNLHVIAADCL